VLREPDPQDASKKRWKFVRSDAPFVVDVEKVKQFFTQLNTSKASKVLDPKAKDYGFAQPRLRLNIGLEGGSEVVVTAGGENTETKSIYIQVSDDPLVYELPAYGYQNLDVDDAKFFVSNPLAVDPDKTEKLVIHADSKELSFNPKEKKWESLTTYLNDLKALVPAKLILDPNDQKKVQSPARFWIELKKEGGEPAVVDFGDVISDQDKDHVVRKRDNTLPFAISDSVYKKLFENLDRLNEPPPALVPSTTPPAAVAVPNPPAGTAAPVQVSLPQPPEKK